LEAAASFSVQVSISLSSVSVNTERFEGIIGLGGRFKTLANRLMDEDTRGSDQNLKRGPKGASAVASS